MEVQGTRGKKTARLEERLEDAEDAGFLEVIVEILPPSSSSGIDPTLPRAQRIAASQALAANRFAPIEAAIAELGGQVLERAWINHTLRARLPVHGILALAQHEDLVLLDLACPLAPDRN